MITYSAWVVVVVVIHFITISAAPTAATVSSVRANMNMKNLINTHNAFRYHIITFIEK